VQQKETHEPIATVVPPVDGGSKSCDGRRSLSAAGSGSECLILGADVVAEQRPLLVIAEQRMWRLTRSPACLGIRQI